MAVAGDPCLCPCSPSEISCCTLCSGEGSPVYLMVVISGVTGSGAIFNGTWGPAIATGVFDQECTWVVVTGDIRVKVILLYPGTVIPGQKNAFVVAERVSDLDEFTQMAVECPMGLHDCFQTNWLFDFFISGYPGGQAVVNAVPEDNPRQCAICCGQDDLPPSVTMSCFDGTGTLACLNGFSVVLTKGTCPTEELYPYYENPEFLTPCHGTFFAFASFLCVVAGGESTGAGAWRALLSMFWLQDVDSGGPNVTILIDECTPLHYQFRYSFAGNAITIDITP